MTSPATILLQSADLLQIPEPMHVWEWAAREVTLESESSPVTGPYDPDFAPYQKEPQESFLDPQVQATVMQWAARLGKTMIELNLIGYKIAREPTRMLVVYPTLDSGTEWAKNFFEPMRRNTAVIADRVSDPKARDGDNTILGKKFPGGFLKIIGSNSPSGFRQTHAGVIVCDEIDAMEAGKEGDPLELASKRGQGYSDLVEIYSSTVTIKGLSRIEALMKDTDRRKWFVTCEGCGHEHLLEWKNFDFSKKGTVEHPLCVCPQCGHGHDDEARLRIIRAGRWVPTQKFRGRRGYDLNGLYCVLPPKKGFVSMSHQMVVEFFRAKEKGKDALITWTNLFLNEPWEEEGETLEWDTIRDRAVPYDPEPLPEPVRFITIAADVQGGPPSRIEAEAVGWGRDFTPFGLGYYVFEGPLEEMETWQPFADLLRRKWRHPSGGNIGPARAHVDMGFRDDLVLSFCRRMLAEGTPAYPVKGADNDGGNRPPVIGRGSRNNRLKVLHFIVGSVASKFAVYQSLNNAPGTAGGAVFPKGHGYDDEYYRQLTAEKLVERYSHGQPYKTFVNPSKKPNEALDIRCYNFAAAVGLSPNWDRLDANFQPAKDAAKAAEPQLNPLAVNGPSPSPPNGRRVAPRRKGTGGGFAGSW